MLMLPCLLACREGGKVDNLSTHKWTMDRSDSRVLRSNTSFSAGREEYDIGGANLERMNSLYQQQQGRPAGQWILEVSTGGLEAACML